ncbi:uncharacterized protein LOC106160739 [Lingula anatina]|uniref:Uncharacterized protein LOC106160739 n=1 Tax=Lingula anatina TaxID=7574 RepID=A0A1S3I3Q1_LINAN|nr:uncharacterized protein LOC106160739 [Lingula anatina]|eukprot:XP_013392863.1 uncharacterized protein LOC106160739 [Lingula anatina]
MKYLIVLMAAVQLAYSQTEIIRTQGPTVSPAEFCQQCVEERNGVGHYENPDDCRSHFSCQRRDDGTVYANLMPCSPGTLFERSVATCVPCADATCDGCACPDPKCPPLTFVPESTTTEPMPPKGPQSCEGNDGWRNFEAEGSTNKFVREMTINQTLYQELVYCGPTDDWRFDVSPDVCACTTLPENAVLIIPFDAQPFKTYNNGDWVDAKDVGITAGRVGNAADMNGTQQIEIPRMDNTYWGTQVTLNIDFNADPNGNDVKRNVLSTGSCNIPPTIELNLREDNTLECKFRVIDVNGTETNIVETIPGIQRGSWNNAQVVFDGLSFRVYLNGQLQFTSVAVGTIPYTLAPLFLGRSLNCEVQEFVSNTRWYGQLDELQVYQVVLSDYDRCRVRNGGHNVIVENPDVAGCSQ